MATKTVEEIYEEHIRSLRAIDRLKLIELIVRGLSASIGHDLQPSHSLLELEGLGEEIWQGIEAQSYVDELRREWGERP